MLVRALPLFFRQLPIEIGNYHRKLASKIKLLHLINSALAFAESQGMYWTASHHMNELISRDSIAHNHCHPSEPGASEGHSWGRRNGTGSLVWFCQETHKCFIRPPQKIKPPPMTSFDCSVMGRLETQMKLGQNEGLLSENPKTPRQNPFPPIWSCMPCFSLNLKRKKIIRLSQQGQPWSHPERKLHTPPH